ncbi:transcription factor SOX-21 isoform X1 [Tribolium castaneum]|uniref:transcription factor SOX-21 isoform X1 n=1 Tax=Tribolium castaneum TaxID=7070 RepID=UPI0030FE5417
MNYCIKRELFDDCKDKPKIPRPPNAFMLYANENRKKMSQLYPTESNKDISKRLGNGWKSLNEDERKKYFDRAKAIGLQHKKEFPDYVYNPKEARIRKAMRDASRERSIAGTSPMLARPNARRAPSHGWGAPSHDDHLMMSPLGGMQPPSCSFAMSGGGDQFMGGGISAYNKLEAAAAPPPPPPPSAGSVHTNYLQSNPLAQLQQHAEMWPDYHTMRSRSSGESFMMGDVAPYSGQTPEMGPIMLDKQPTPATSPPTAAPDKEPDQDQFIPVFEQPEEAKAKNKSLSGEIFLPLSSQRLRASPNLFSNDLEYQSNYILEYFQSMPSMTLMNITTPNGTTFPYATYTPSDLIENINNEAQVFENVTEPSFFHTDVGFVPLSSV